MRGLSTFASVGRLHIVAIAALGTLTFGWLFTGHRPFELAAITALDWFLVNLLNRVVDLEEDKANRIVGTDFVSRNRKALVWLGFSVLGLSMVAVHLIYPEITALRVGYHCLGLAYNWPMLPGGRRIKQLYFFKNTASATGFMLTVFGYPLAHVVTGTASFAPGVGWATVGFGAAFFFLFELSYEVIYDLRDATGDALAKVRTFVVVHGESGALRIIDGLLIGACLSLVIGYATSSVPWRLFVMIAAPVMQWVIYKRALKRGLQARDCIQATWLGAGLLAAYHIWVWLDLPGVQA